LSETDLGVFGGKGQNMFVVVPFVASGIPAVKAFVAKAKLQGGADATVSNYVMTHYHALTAMKAAIEKAGKGRQESMIDGLEGLAIKSPTGPVTVGKNHHAAMNMFIAKTKGRDLVTVTPLGESHQPGCQVTCELMRAGAARQQVGPYSTWFTCASILRRLRIV
jgi:branched-chain amino acid transport system substrate-binding protein/urea transport system substrate-binding protein